MDKQAREALREAGDWGDQSYTRLDEMLDNDSGKLKKVVLELLDQVDELEAAASIAYGFLSVDTHPNSDIVAGVLKNALNAYDSITTTGAEQ